MRSQRFRRGHKKSKVRKGRKTRNRRRTMRRRNTRRRTIRRKRTRRRRGGMDPQDRDQEVIDRIASQTQMSDAQKKKAFAKTIPKHVADEAKNSTSVDAARIAAQDTRPGPDFSSIDFPAL